MASTCDERAGSSPAEDPAARILFGSLSASRVLAPMTGACVGSPQSAGRAAVRTGGPWCVERTVRLSPEDEQQDLVKRALRFDKSTVSSVGTAIGQLNRAAIQCDSGLCVVFSMSAQANFLLYRQDREQDVARAGMQAAGRTAAPPTVGAMTPAPPRPSCLGPDHPRPSLAGCGAVPVAASPQLPIRRLRFDSPDARPPNQLAQQPRSPKASTGEVTPRSVTLARVDESVSATPALPGSPARTKASCKLSTLSEEVTLTMSRLPLSKAALKHGDALETPQHGGFFTPRSLKHLPCSPTKDTAQRAMTLSPKATECYHEISASPIRASFAALSREEQPSKPEANDGKTFTIGGRQFGFLDVIGRGAFGVVWRAREQDASGEDVAVKVITCTDAAGFANATFEAELLQMLSAARSRMHSHIPGYVAHSAAKDADPSSGGVVRLAMSYVPGGAFDRWIYGISDEDHKSTDIAKLVDGHFPGGQQGLWAPEEACALTREMLVQLAPVFAALRPIAFHRDVSAHNVLIEFAPGASRTRPRFALIDFGLAVRSSTWGQKWRSSNLAGDPRYWTPAAWMAFAFGFKYVTTHPNSGFQQQYLSRMDHFSLGVMGLEALFVLCGQQAGDAEGLREARDAWAVFWAIVVKLFQTFHTQGATEARALLAQAHDGAVGELVASLRRLRQALRAAAARPANGRWSALLLVLADLVDENGCTSWADVSALLSEEAAPGPN